uniref:Uncharacterized protein n=1 Tax=uncultured bacterium Contig26 TaxID=1393545 RepID=W0FNW2_9BACT|nr:hypothetical protein [uncultured bacterium Contig26]
MTALSGSPYLSSGTAFLIGEAVFFVFLKTSGAGSRDVSGNSDFTLTAVSCTFWKASYAPGDLMRSSDVMAACQILILDLQVQIL